MWLKCLKNGFTAETALKYYFLLQNDIDAVKNHWPVLFLGCFLEMEMVGYMQNLSTKVVQIGLRVCSFKMSKIWQKFIKKGMLLPKIICETFIF